MSTLRLVADDLTGALDAGAQFTGLLGSIPCALGPRSPWLSDLSGRDVAVNAACRDGEESSAVTTTTETASIFVGAKIAFKKIDSLLRGHWAAELAAITRTHRFRDILFCPAFPAQKRIMRDGRQWIAAADGSWVRLTIDPAAELERRGVRTARVEPRQIASVRDVDLLMSDAESQTDLDALARVADAMPGPVLWCGSAGLARALSGRPPQPIDQRGTPHLAIVGTRHPVSQGQIAHLLGRAAHCVVTIDDDPRSSARRIATALAESGRCLALPGPPGETSPAAAAAIIARRLRETFVRVAAPACLTVTGGETFLALCDALGTGGLDIMGEVSPGVPASRMVGGMWEGTLILSKSGAFGREADLSRLLGVDRQPGS